MHVVEVDDNPYRAIVAKADNTIYVDRKWWTNLCEMGREFTVMHEAGHIYLGTDNENNADLYAAKKLLEFGYSKYQVIAAMHKALQGVKDKKGRINHIKTRV